MKFFCKTALVILCTFISKTYAQKSTLDIAAMHQLIPQSIDENKLQVKAKNQQAVNTANEQTNLTLLAKLKNTYRTLQQRYNTLGTAINVAEIGVDATPMVKQIILYQTQIVQLPRQPNPGALGFGDRNRICRKGQRPIRLYRRFNAIDRRCQSNESFRPQITV